MLEAFKEKLSKNKNIYLRVKAIPAAPKTEFKEALGDGTIKISVAAAAQKGKANEELIKYLAREFAVSKKDVKILTGIRERLKLIKITYEKIDEKRK